MNERQEQILQEMSSAGQTISKSTQELSSLSTAVALLEERQGLEDEQSALEELSREAAESSEKDLEEECLRAFLNSNAYNDIGQHSRNAYRVLLYLRTETTRVVMTSLKLVRELQRMKHLCLQRKWSMRT